MGFIASIHFLFWKGLIFPPLTILDRHSLAMTLIIGSILLATLYNRFHTYFMPEDLIKKPPKTLDQVKLFSLGEVIPTFIVLSIIMWIFRSTNLQG